MPLLHRRSERNEARGIYMLARGAWKGAWKVDLAGDDGCASHNRSSHATTMNVTRMLATDGVSG